MRLGAYALTAAAVAAIVSRLPAQEPLHGQHWDVAVETARPTVGDTVTISFRVRLDERDLLYDTVPAPALTPPSWVRIISVDKLQRQPDRIFVGRARLAFYRPGHQNVPVFQLPFMRSVKGLTRGTFLSDVATIDVVPTLVGGSSATLRDIKEPSPGGGRVPTAVAIGLVALLALGGLAWLTRRRVPSAAPTADEPVLPRPPDPYGIALARLDAIGSHPWTPREVTRYYADVADVLRDYLAAAEGVPARERTSTELLGVLPPHLRAEALHRVSAGVFSEADLVKFARRRPGRDAASAFLAEARSLLAAWRDAAPEPESVNAVR
jgi:hypothetical protein